ncbi:MAG: TonB-dependent receptor [Asticcacaulis sp.]
MNTQTNTAENWFWAVQDTNRNVIDSNGVYTTFDHAVGLDLAGYAYTRLEQYRPTTTNQLGFNTKWTPSDTFNGVLDLSWSRAINDNRGLDADYTLEALNQPGFLVHSDGGVPWIEDNGAFRPTEANEVKLRARQTSNSGTYVRSENWQAKTDFNWILNDKVSFDFGASYGNQGKHNEFWQTPQAVRRLYHSNATHEVVDTTNIITGILQPGDVFGNSKLNGDMYVIDGEALRAWMADPVNLANRDNPTASLADFEANGRTWNAVKSGDSYQIDERDTSAYIDLHWNTQLLSKPLGIVTGLRYSKTQLTSDGTMRILTDLYQAMCGDHPCENSGILTPVYSSTDLTRITVKHDYANWLPSLNARWDIADDMVLRLSASQTMTRPTLEDLAPQITYRSLFKVERTATGNNPI